MTSQRTAWPLALVGIVLVLAGLAAFVFWRVETWPARTAAGISQAFRQTFEFDPRISVDNEVVLEQSTDVAELAVVQRTLSVERGYENRWLFSTKRLRARGTYAVKAGFDLRKGVDVEVDKAGGRVVVTFPAPELLSVEQEKVEIVEWDNGLWNRLGAEDTETAVNAMGALARDRAAAEGLLEEARRSVTEQITARLLEQVDLEVAVEFRS